MCLRMDYNSMILVWVLGNKKIGFRVYIYGSLYYVEKRNL